MLSTKINGIAVTSCLGNASGCHCTNSQELDILGRTEGCSWITTKSSTIESRIGNEEPRFAIIESGSINSMGIPNYGYSYYMEYIKKNPGVIHSIYPFNIEELHHMLMDIAELGLERYIIEVNMSCPNVIGKNIIGYDYEMFEAYLDEIDDIWTHLAPDITFGLKLPPYYLQEQFDIVSNIIKQYDSIKFITCINSVINGIDIDINTEKPVIKPKDGYGGIGGIYCLPTALANVRNFNKLLGDKVAIIGCGGVRSGIDVYKHILCGASIVQIGSTLMNEGPACFERIERELLEIMSIRGYKHIEEFRGII